MEHPCNPSGGIAYLSHEDLADIDGNPIQFTILEVYGGAHVAFLGSGVNRMAVEMVVGDDTGYIHIRPGYTLDVNDVGCLLSNCVVIVIVINNNGWQYWLHPHLIW